MKKNLWITPSTHRKRKVVHFTLMLRATLYILYTVAITAGKETARKLVSV